MRFTAHWPFGLGIDALSLRCVMSAHLSMPMHRFCVRFCVVFEVSKYLSQFFVANFVTRLVIADV